jgi:hypothetical protein
MRKFTKLLVVVVALFMSSVAIKAQTTGSLTGTITDPKGAVVPGATVTARNNETNDQRTATTNDSGVFSLSQLSPGGYTVTVENAGFKKLVSPDVKVSVSSETTLSLSLEIGAVGETVTVTSAQDVVNTTSPTLTNVINTRQVNDLPLGSRNPLELAALQAGIAVTGTGTRTANVGGLRGSSTNVTQDGINAMDNFVKTDALFANTVPSLASTSEFSITTGTTGPDAGRGAAQVNIVTRGGTNEYHGNLFYLMRNSALEANNWFNNYAGSKVNGDKVSPRPDEHQHYYGFTIGGPIHFFRFGEGGPRHWSGKDHAWFFYSYEGFRENFQQTRNRTVLSAAARTGIFTYAGANGATTTVNLLNLGNFHSLNPLTMAQINAMPACNNTQVGDTLNTCGFQYNVTGSDPYDKHVFRYDQQLTKSEKFELVYNHVKTSLFPDTFNSIEAAFPGATNAGQASIRGLFTTAIKSVFGQSTNELRYGRQWSPVAFLRESQPTTPFLSFASVTNFDNSFMDQGRKAEVNEVVDNYVVPMGNHMFKLGGDWQQVFAHTFNDASINQLINLGSNTANPSGITSANFPNLPSGSTGTALVTRATNIYTDLVGQLASSSITYNVKTPTSGFVRGYTRARDFMERDLALYFSDQWRFRSNLTLSYGVRWEYEGVPVIPNDLAIQLTNFNDIYGVSGPGNLFNPNAAIPGASGTPAKGQLNFVSGQTGIGLYKNDFNNYAPFAGLAYSPSFKSGPLHLLFGDEGKSSIRMGYSISYLHDGFTVISNAMGTGVTNPGLIQSGTNLLPTGVLGAGGVPLPVPVFTLPLSDKTNFDTLSTNGLWAIDPNLRTPYVQQWNVGFEREIAKDTAIEVRYVGNHAIKVYRANDINEVNIFENGFLNEFKNAAINLNARGGASATSFAPGCVGCVATPMLDKFFAGLPASSGYTSSAFIQNILSNNVASIANSLAFVSTYRNNLRTQFPANFFVANPNAAFAVVLNNNSMSNYNSLQIELRRRFSEGLQFQANYTFAKALTDASGGSGVQSDLVNYRTLRNTRLDYMRASFDQTHRFVANALYELPFGHGKSFWNGGGFMDKVVGGWSLGSIVTWQSRPPWYVSAARSSVNCTPSRAATSNGCTVNITPAKLTGMSFDDFRKHIGMYMTSVGPFAIDPALLCIKTSTNGTTCKPDGGSFVSSIPIAGLFTQPDAGSFGNFPVNSLNGPAYFNVDMSLIKRIPVGERVKLELKTTFINMLNHPNWVYNTQAFDSTTFGRITSTSGNSRVIHFQGTMSF